LFEGISATLPGDNFIQELDVRFPVADTLFPAQSCYLASPQFGNGNTNGDRRESGGCLFQKVFGFAKRGIMNGPYGKAIHAELTLRGTTLMLGPEMPQMGSRGATAIDTSPTSLYLLTENADKVVAKAVKLGAAPKGSVMDMASQQQPALRVAPE
jgi:hypothetical protein